jgi:glycosyltransferase involved in cell wall biosynthesis
LTQQSAISNPDLALPAHWELPAFDVTEFRSRRGDFCIVIPVINEGDRIRRQLAGMAEARLGFDIIIVDGGSTDGSTAPETLARIEDMRALLVKTGPGKLSAQLRIGFAYALQAGYRGVITIDGNGKDGFEAIPSFVLALQDGYGFVQGSRYIATGAHEHTPLDRELGVRVIHAPIISLAAGFHYTDTTNGFRAFSAELLSDPAVHPFRVIFDTYNLHYYLSVRAPRLGYRVTELPVVRRYPPKGKTPTKISGFKGRLHIIKQLLLAAVGAYNPRSAG